MHLFQQGWWSEGLPWVMDPGKTARTLHGWDEKTGPALGDIYRCEDDYIEK